MAGQPQEPVTFEDVTVFLSRAEWDALPEGQRELYRDVVSNTYELLTSLGYPGPKPDILHRLERGEEPWICPSSGHTGSWLEESSCGWWSGAGGCQGPEEWLEPWCPGQSTSRGLQSWKLEKNFGRLEEWSEFPLEADAGAESPAPLWVVKEEVEDEPELAENLTVGEMLVLHSAMEQQSADPWEQLWGDPWEGNHGNAQTHGHTSLPEKRELSVDELRAATAKDHSYCLRNEPGTPSASRRCCLWEHSYSRECRRRRRRKRRESGAARCRLDWQRSRAGRVVRKARQILRRYRPYRRFPWRGCSGCCALARGTDPGDSLPTDPPALGNPRSAGNAEGVTLNTQRTLEGILRTGVSHPASIPATGASNGAKPPEDPGPNLELEGRVGFRKSQRVPLQEVFRDVLAAVAFMLDSMCHRFELQGFSQGKSIWPIVIQIDNLGEVRKP